MNVQHFTCDTQLYVLFFSSETDGFCQEAVFSLTTDYNNGAMSCDCSPEGSRNFACGNFGGQCECRPNVIGRACTQCANGFYDFPNCKRVFIFISN